jgi:hypothetical protein
MPMIQHNSLPIPELYIAAIKRFDQRVGEMEKIAARLKKQKKF